MGCEACEGLACVAMFAEWCGFRFAWWMVVVGTLAAVALWLTVRKARRNEGEAEGRP